MTKIPPAQAFLNKWDQGNLQHSMTKPHGGDGTISMAETGLNLDGIASKHVLPPGREGEFVAELDRLMGQMSPDNFKAFVDEHLDPMTMTTFLYHRYPDLFGDLDPNQNTTLGAGEIEDQGGIDAVIDKIERQIEEPGHAYMLSKARLIFRNRIGWFDRGTEDRLRDAAERISNPPPQTTQDAMLVPKR